MKQLRYEITGGIPWVSSVRQLRGGSGGCRVWSGDTDGSREQRGGGAAFGNQGIGVRIPHFCDPNLGDKKRGRNYQCQGEGCAFPSSCSSGPWDLASQPRWEGIIWYLIVTRVSAQAPQYLYLQDSPFVIKKGVGDSKGLRACQEI